MKDLTKVFKSSKTFIYGILITLIVAWILSGTYSITHEEAGVVTVFGNISGKIMTPGIHYHLPWPVGKLYRVNIKELRSVEIGHTKTGFKGQLSNDLKYKIVDYSDGAPSVSFMDARLFNKQFITGDNNIVDILLVVQYKIISPDNYLFSFTDPDALITLEAESALNYYIATSTIDRLLLRDTLFTYQMTQDLQKRLEPYNIGVSVESLFFKDVMVPEGAVEAAFRDVKSAEVDRGKRIEVARNKANAILSQAGSESRQILDSAKTESEQIKNTAVSDSTTFLKLEKEIEEKGTILNYHLWLSTMSNILGRAKLYIVTDNEALNTIYLQDEN